jgi:hypothetical protein
VGATGLEPAFPYRQGQASETLGTGLTVEDTEGEAVSTDIPSKSVLPEEAREGVMRAWFGNLA